jgi:hypothetical protein
MAGYRGSPCGLPLSLFWSDDHGWVPLDASEARKHLELKDELFGSLPADRIAFTRGRDHQLPGAAAPLVNS